MLSIFLIGLALSIDAFSISLGIGMKLSKKELYLTPVMVGIMHFLMPLIGHYFGNMVLSFININSKIIVSIILFYLALLMFLDRNKDNYTIIKSFISIVLFSLSVSLDSFSIGIGLNGLTDNYVLSCLVFTLCSSCLTFIGLIISKYTIHFLKRKAVYLGIAILLFLSVVNFCQVFK